MYSKQNGLHKIILCTINVIIHKISVVSTIHNSYHIANSKCKTYLM